LGTDDRIAQVAAELLEEVLAAAQLVRRPARDQRGLLRGRAIRRERRRRGREPQENLEFLKRPGASIPKMAWPRRMTLSAAPEKSGKSSTISLGCAAATRAAACS